MHKFLKIALIVLGVLSAILWVNLPDADMPAAEAVGSGAMSAMFVITYILLAVAVAFSVFFAIKKTFSKSGNVKRTMMSLGTIVLIVIISYIAADGTDVTAVGDLVVEESTVKNIGMGLNVFYILTTIAVLLMVVPSMKKLLFKK